MRYSDIRAKLKTGDIVLFSGKGFISAGIKFATRSKWSHVGMVIILPEYDFVVLWESTTLSKTKELKSGALKRGVQIVPLSERIKNHDGDVAIRSLEGIEFDSGTLQSLMSFRKEIAGRDYEKDQIELLKSAYDGPFGGNEEDLSTLFCSELCAEAYQRLGLLSEDKPSNEYTPADFSDKKDLHLLQGYLGPEVLITP